ncbi:MAG: iron-containing alcohol dehydrogenase [Clostridia bacterium]|nr:iron-containing alcohol dehydrogenase [Clostridia bacterium]
MLDFAFCNPTQLVFGRKALEGLGERVKKWSERVLVVYGGGSVKRSGLLDRVHQDLTASGVWFQDLPGVQPNPVISLVRTGVEICKREKIGLILAVGGGSVIDTSKAIGLGALYDGDPWDFFCGRQAEATVPVGVILTIPAAGSENSMDAVVTNEESGLKRASCAGDFIRPVFSLLNPELTFTLPPYQTACGVCDMIAHVLERYFTLTPHVDLTDRLSEALIVTVMENAPIVLKDPENYDARAEIMLCGTYAHNGSLGVGRASDWASHGMGHEISALTGAAHGATLAVIMPTWMKYVLHTDVRRFAQLAERVMGVKPQENEERTALAGIDAFRAFLTGIGLPEKLSELGVRESDIPLLARKCHSTGNGFRKLNEEDIAAIYRMAL